MKQYGTLYPISETSKIKPKKIIGFDTETYGDDNKFLLGTIYTNNEQKTFYKREEMQEYLLSQEDNTYIVASNLAFDFSVIFYNSEHFYKFQQIINGSQLISAIYESTNIQKKYVNIEGKEQLYKRKTIYFIDTYNYIQGSVEYYGKILNIEKLEKPKTLSEIPKTPEEWKELETYCMRDSEITYKFTMFLQENYNNIGTNMKLTSSSTSMELFKRKYLHRTINSEESHMMNINKKIFASYYGGRTEIFKRGYYKNMNYYDFCSLYPSVMLNEYPDPDTAKYVTYPSKEIIEYEGVSEVIMEIEEMNIPILPVMYKKLLFPIGKIRGTYTHLEIRKAIEQGYSLKKILWSIYYRKTFQPFKMFVEDMYGKRMKYKEENNKAELIYKLLMNSLYGKFAQKNMSEIKFIDYNDLEEKEKIFQEYPEHHGIKYIHNDDGKGYLVKKAICKSSFVRPIFSTYTTAYGRIKLWDVINKYDGAYSDSVHKDTLIHLKDEDITVEELWNRNNGEVLCYRGKEFRMCQSEILTCNDSKKNEYIIPKQIIRHKVKTELVKINLTNQEHIICTKNHSLINKHLKSIKSKDVKVGMKILVATKIPNKVISDSKFTIKEFELMGHIIGNGNILKQSNSKSPNYISLSSKYINKIIEIVIKPIQKKYKFNITKKDKKTDIIINCSELARKYYNYEIRGNSATKIIPKSLYNESTSSIIAFLRGYFNADGSISIRNNSPIIKVDSINKKLLDGVSKLLRIIGIAHSRFQENNKTHYKNVTSKYKMQRINILDKKLFMKLIGFNNGSDNKKYNLNDDVRGYGFDFIERRVKSIETINYNDYVYDLSIHHYERFYANNILVHNTDSVVTRKEVGNSSKLGDLKLETTIRKGIFVKPKCYTFTDHKGKEVTRLKGIPKANIDTFERILSHKNVEYMKFTKMKESIKQNIMPNKKITMVKKMNLEDNKRIWTTKFNPIFYDEFSKPYKVIM